MPAIKPCLWFHADAEEAASFYVSLFPDSKLVPVMRAGGGGVRAVSYRRKIPAGSRSVPFQGRR